MILFIHLQQQHVPNNPHKFYSNRRPRLFTTARNRRRHDAIEVRIWFIGNFRHSARRCFFSESTLRCWTALTLASKMPHMEKSSGFKSGLEGGDSDDEMKSGIWAWDQSWNFWLCGLGPSPVGRSIGPVRKLVGPQLSGSIQRSPPGNTPHWFWPPIPQKTGEICPDWTLPPDHHRPRLLETLNGSLLLRNIFEGSCVNPVILSVQMFFDDEQLLIGEHDAFHVARIAPLKQRFRSLESRSRSAASTGHELYAAYTA
jgi:hypothetical protein